MAGRRRLLRAQHRRIAIGIIGGLLADVGERQYRRRRGWRPRRVCSVSPRAKMAYRGVKFSAIDDASRRAAPAARMAALREVARSFVTASLVL